MTGARPSGTLWRMVNLIRPRSQEAGLVCLDAEPRGRVETRLAALAGLARHDRLDDSRRLDEALEGELEELAERPSRIAALALLATLDGLRLEASGTITAGARAGAVLARGDYLGHRPGRALATGEAEIASRGYFDVEDRPPIACWIGLLVPAIPAPKGEEDLVVVAWIPERALERARAGCRACPNGALLLLSESAPEAHRRLRAIEARIADG